MHAIKRLAVAYVGVGFVIAVIENWTAQARGGLSALDIVGSALPIGDKVQIALDMLVMPIFAWPIQVLAMIRGG